MLDDDFFRLINLSKFPYDNKSLNYYYNPVEGFFLANSTINEITNNILSVTVLNDKITYLEGLLFNIKQTVNYFGFSSINDFVVTAKEVIINNYKIDDPLSIFINNNEENLYYEYLFKTKSEIRDIYDNESFNPNQFYLKFYNYIMALSLESVNKYIVSKIETYSKTIDSDFYFNEFFKEIGNYDNLSLYNFFHKLLNIKDNFKSEISKNLENKVSDSSKLIYIKRISERFSSLFPNFEDIFVFELKYKKKCDKWCQQFNCENSPDLFLYKSSIFNSLFDSISGNLLNNNDFPNPKNIFFDFLHYIRFNSIKEVYESLINQERIINPPPIPAEKPTDGSGFITEKNLVFINLQFKNQIQRNGLTANHIIHSNFPILNFDIARKEILSYINSNDKLTLSRIYNLADNSVSLYNSKLKYFTENELSVNTFNAATQKMEYVNKYIDEQYYKLIDDSISNISSDFVDFSTSQYNLKTYSFFNDQLFKYCNNILIYLNENNSEIFNQKKHDTMIEEKIESDFLSDMYYSRMLYDSFKKDRNLLKMYIEIESKKANANFVDYETFFNRCYDTIISFYKAVEISFNERKNELNSILDRAINKKTDFKNHDKDLTPEQKFQEDIDYCNNELATLDITKFSADISPLTKHEFDSFLKYNEIQFIKNAIDEAFENYKSKIIVTTNVKELSINESPDENKNNFKCIITDENKLKKLFMGLKDEFINTTEDNFLAICNGDIKFTKIEWVHKNNKKRFNQTSLICLFSVLTGIQTKPTNQLTNEFFYIKDIKEIILKSPKKDAYYKRYISKFSSLLN